MISLTNENPFGGLFTGIYLFIFSRCLREELHLLEKAVGATIVGGGRHHGSHELEPVGLND